MKTRPRRRTTSISLEYFVGAEGLLAPSTNAPLHDRLIPGLALPRRTCHIAPCLVVSRSQQKAPVTTLTRGVFALAKTKRKRFLWCAWWTGEPTAKPFRPPDAWGGGARTREEAQALAERAAARPLSPVDDHWAGAWKRVVAGLEPFPKHTARTPSASTEPARPLDPFAVLGLTSAATLEEVRRAFRKLALEHHPDQGGATESFIAARRAYDSIVKRRSRRGPH